VRPVGIGLGPALRVLGFFSKIRRELDVVHFHGFTRKMVLLHALARLTGLPIVQKASSVGGDDPVTMAHRGLSGRVYATADRFVSISPGMTARFRAAHIPPHKVCEIPNGVDLERFRPPRSPAEARELRARLDLPLDVPVIVFVGFFSRDKAPHVLFDAWRRLSAAAGESCLVYIGSTDPAHLEVDPALVTTIRRDVERGGLEKRVRWIEHTPDVDAYLRAADVFAAPSRREGLSNALLEAMASGLAVVASRLEGVTAGPLLDGTSGLLVPPDDVAALAYRLEAVLTDPALRRRLGVAARARAEEAFGIDGVAARYLDLYRELASSAKVKRR
jgi:glycosyltransferase involved in cell wall biosynthesis